MAYLSNHRQVGDPGFFGALGRMAKGATIGLLTGGPAGAVLGAAGGLANVPQAGLPSANAGMLSPSTPPIYSGGLANSGYPPRLPPPAGLPHVPAPVGSPGSYMPLMPNPSVSSPGQVAPKGYRLNKTGYFLKNGTYVAPGTKWVRYRTRNNLNQKALRRAISRAQGFDKLVKRNRKGLRALARI